MKNLLLVALFALFVLTACVVTPGPGNYGVEVAPALPSVVVLDAEPYYQQHGYFYFYQNERWHYSRSRGGPWLELPRSHWPSETRHHGRGHDHGRDEMREHERR
jgi:hypothetical protein